MTETATPVDLRPPGGRPSIPRQALGMVGRIDIVALMPYLYLIAFTTALYAISPVLLTGTGSLDVRATAVLPLALALAG